MIGSQRKHAGEPFLPAPVVILKESAGGRIRTCEPTKGQDLADRCKASGGHLSPARFPGFATPAGA